MATIYVNGGASPGGDGSSGHPFTTINAAVGAAGAGDTIVVASGIYVEQVVVSGKTGLTIEAAPSASVTIDAPADVTQTALSSSGRALNAVVTVLNSTNVTLANINVDGGGHGDTVDGTNANFVGVAYRDSSGGLTGVNVTGIHDPYPGGLTPGGEPVQSGNQRGVGVQVDNDSLQSFFMHGGSISDFQKNATVFNYANLDVSGVTVTGGGAQTINAQNGFQATNSTGSISGNTVTGIGYAGPADAYSGEFLLFDNTNLDVKNNIISGSNNESTNAKVVGIYVFDAENGGAITGNTISNVDTGVGVYDNATALTIANNAVTNVDLTDPFAANLDIEANAGSAFSGTSASEIISGGTGNDTITGGGGNDTILGGGGTDTAVYASVLTAASFSYDTADHEWVVTSAADGTDHLNGITKVTDGGGHTFWLVDPSGATTSVQAAINAASAGDYILIAGGTYTESAVPTEASSTAGGLYISKTLTLQGYSGLDGSMVTSAATAQQYGPTIISGSQTDFGSNDFIGVNAANTVINGLHLQAGESTNNKLLEIWGNNATVTNSYLDVNAPIAGYTGAVAIYLNDNGDPATDNITSYTINGNDLNEGIVVANGVGNPSLGVGANQKITNNTFQGTFDPSTGLGRYDTVVINGQVNGIGWLLEPTQTPTVSGNSFGDNSTPFILRGSDNSAANLPSAAQIASMLATNGNGNSHFAYVLKSDGSLQLASRNDGSGPYFSFAVTNSIDTLNLALDATPDDVFGGQRNYIVSGDTVVVQSGDTGTVNSQIMVDNLTVNATNDSGDLNLSLATQFADGSAIPGGGVANISLAGGANVDVLGNGLDNVISGNNGNNTLVGDGGSDFLTGGSGDDVLNGGSGNDVLDGGGGVDEAVFSGPRSSYTLTHNSNGSWSVSGPEGSDTLTTVERAVFSDQTIELRVVPVADFSGEGRGDIFFQNSNGSIAVWLQNGLTFTAADSVGANPGPSWVVKGSGDFNGDANCDIVLQNSTTGQVAAWLMNGLSVVAADAVHASAGTAWSVVGTGDFNSDMKSDIVLQNNSTGQIAVWLMNGLNLLSGDAIAAGAAGGWQIKGVGDFDGDGKSDLLLQNSSTNQVAIWMMNGLSVKSADAVHADAGTVWKVKGTGDFNGDGKSDILLQNSSTSQVAVWLMNGLSIVGGDAINASAAGGWTVKGAEDLNGDGNSDILLQNSNGTVAAWLMNGLTVTAANAVGSNPGSVWQVIAPTG